VEPSRRTFAARIFSSSKFCPRAANRAIFIAFFALAFFFAGCAKKSPRKPQARKETGEERPVRRTSPSHKGPRLAIILDDMGNDRVAADSLLALPFPLTLSVLPHLPLSTEIADEASRRGDEVMLHLPMQPDSETTPSEAIELRLGMPGGEVRSVLAGMLETVPHASGVNNHEGSKATADSKLMDALMPVLRDRGLFFIDSRTTASTVAYDTARRYGVRTASRKVFLDDSLENKAIREQVDLAERDAEHDGEAIAIGHPHPETIAVLREMLPRLKRQGVQLVFASDLVH
jgi:uncharacterized protein